ncbi:MAG: CAAX protease family protein [Microbacterium sp. 71-36]|uniref:CPBP family intramembrane glutamic endopeptidase n=1 Tax=unclassified Microbacterium TaxID=2609290 RepID=UPI00092C0863|nr:MULTISPECIES: CPBP family intramembrane glutamic endopeptidase [unclassified Microbacterium]MBN9212567.1 CPBP family intramembrane metalloprotease [Microbacterium sp.]OJV74260.1 MAG: CAAX protease family protein [Microbacterium sp. 71-36]
MTASSRPDWIAIGVFAVTSVALSWLVALPLWLRGSGLADPFLGLFAAAMMFTPTLGVLAALQVQRRTRGRRGARVVLRELGMWPLRPAARTVWTCVAVIIAAPLLVAVGLAVVAAVGVATFDLVGFSGFRETLEAAVPAGTPLPPVALLAAVQLATIPIGALINAPFAFGEELGWRGFLLPALRPLGVWPALLLSGAFWGLWHAPLILLGYNFLEPNAFGVLLMIVACVFFGILLGWTRLRTASVWPAVFAHGAFNASAGLGALVIAAGSATPSPVIAGPLGIVMWGVFAAVTVILVLTGQFRADRLDARLAPDPVRLDPSPSLPSPS